MSDKAEYMRQWRKGNTTARSRQTRAARARDRALRDLADKHPEEFARLLNIRRREEELPSL